jgi:hypothetical protein
MTKMEGSKYLYMLYPFLLWIYFYSDFDYADRGVKGHADKLKGFVAN